MRGTITKKRLSGIIRQRQRASIELGSCGDDVPNGLLELSDGRICDVVAGDGETPHKTVCLLIP